MGHDEADSFPCGWLRLASTDDIPIDAGIAVHHEDRCIAIFNSQGQFYAVDAACPHADGPLHQGFIEDGRICCPWHSWSFQLRYEDSPDDGLRRYRVRVEEGGVFVELPTPSTGLR